MTKRCAVCSIIKERENFSRYKKAKDGLQYTCKLCQAKQYKTWIANNPTYRKKYAKINADKIKNNHLETNFNITLEQFRFMEEQQKGVCAICGLPPKSKRRLCVDHCHKTEKIRQLLCLSCNTLLGSIENGRVPLEKYFDYLEKHNEKTNKEKKQRKNK